jgi:hypothetical protein
MVIRNNLTGKQFGRWTVIRLGPAQTKPEHRIRYWCECQCGTRRLVHAGNLISGMSTSCGCKQLESLEKVHEVNRHDLTGQRSGMLTIVRRVQTNPVKWLCMCDCGKERIVRSASLGSETPHHRPIRSCGCTRRPRKLTKVDVLAIREMYKLPQFSLVRLGTLFNVDPSHISRIVRGLRGGKLKPDTPSIQL